jgi:hypothetical protein
VLGAVPAGILTTCAPSSEAGAMRVWPALPSPGELVRLPLPCPPQLVELSGHTSLGIGIDPGSPQFQVGQKACQSLLPSGGSSLATQSASGSISPEKQAQLLRFARSRDFQVRRHRARETCIRRRRGMWRGQP